MSSKQETYKELLEFGLVCLRNSQALPPEKRPDSASLFRLADFLHNLPELIVEKDFGSSDLYFINVETKAYLENPDARSDLWFSFFAAKAKKLCDILPDELKS